MRNIITRTKRRGGVCYVVCMHARLYAGVDGAYTLTILDKYVLLFSHKHSQPSWTRMCLPRSFVRNIMQ